MLLFRETSARIPYLSFIHMSTQRLNVFRVSRTPPRDRSTVASSVPQLRPPDRKLYSYSPDEKHELEFAKPQSENIQGSEYHDGT